MPHYDLNFKWEMTIDENESWYAHLVRLRAWMKDNRSIFNFVYKLEKNPNIKESYHVQMYLNTSLDYFAVCQLFSSWTNKGYYVNHIKTMDEVANKIMYILKEETQASCIFTNNSVPPEICEWYFKQWDGSPS